MPPDAEGAGGRSWGSGSSLLSLPAPAPRRAASRGSFRRPGLSPRRRRGAPARCGPGGRRENPYIFSLDLVPTGRAPPFLHLGDTPRGLPRSAPRGFTERRDGRRGAPAGVWGATAPVRGTGLGPPLGTLTVARCVGLAPGRPPRAPGYPTRLSPPGGGGGFNVSPPRSGGTERPGVLSSPFVNPVCLRTLAKPLW